MFAAKRTPGHSHRAAIFRGSALVENTLTVQPTPYRVPYEPSTVHGRGSLVQAHSIQGQEFRSNDRRQGGRSMSSHRGSLQTVVVFPQIVASMVPANRLR